MENVWKQGEFDSRRTRLKIFLLNYSCQRGSEEETRHGHRKRIRGSNCAVQLIRSHKIKYCHIQKASMGKQSIIIMIIVMTVIFCSSIVSSSGGGAMMMFLP